jgi:hypothetical protein
MSAMNYTAATLILALLGIASLDVLLVKQQRWLEPHTYRLEALYLAELQPAMTYPGVLGASPDRARRLFAAWGEWRLGHADAGHFMVYDTSSEAARVFPTPAWLEAGRPTVPDQVGSVGPRGPRAR